MSAKSILDTAWGCIPHFQSRSIPRTIEYYTKVLHFELGGINPEDSDDPNMCSVAVGGGIKGGNIYIFKRAAEDVLHPSTCMIALGTEAVDQYHDILVNEGKAEIVDPIKDREWGYRQFTVRDPDGNQVQFFRFPEGGNPGSGDG
jgi:uncharacterized glyoxalase superfamily protein PhnB